VKTVLLVSYTFPPQYDVSARRVAKLCKYLPSVGWRPIVLTKDWRRDVAPEDERSFVVTMNEAAARDLNGTVVRYAPYRSHDHVLRRLHGRLGGVYGARAPAGSPVLPATDKKMRSILSLPRRALSLASPLFGDFPDAFRGWTGPAVDAGVRVAQEFGVDAVCSVCPPATAHVVASSIARRCQLPWVAQFDDLYSFLIESQRRPAWRWYAGRAHRRWMEQATLVSAITPAMLGYLRRTYGVDGDVVVVGFDPDESASTVPPRGDRLTIAYTGSIYPDDQHPELFFEGLEKMLGGLPDDRRRIEVAFAGTNRAAELRAMIERFPLAARACVFLDRLAPDAALRLQREAHALLLFNVTVLATRFGTLSYPAKTFEYLNARRPILAIPGDPGGWGDELLRSTSGGVTASTPAKIAAVLRGWFDAWQSTGTVPYFGIDAEIQRYAQPLQVAKLADLLDRAMASGLRERKSVSHR
jgi:glycosyltransferase involved in cell wall biosynthesis